MADISTVQTTNGKKIHELKILPEYFDAVRCGDKRFEVRKNDRNFHRGDILRLKEWDGEKFTGESIDALVRYVLLDWQAGLKDNYCVLSIDTMMNYIPRRRITPTPYKTKNTNGRESLRWQCGRCGRTIRYNRGAYGRDDYCPKCGTPVNWDGEQE